MGDPVEQCRRHCRILKHLLPAGELQVAGDDEATRFVALRHKLEEQGSSGPQP